MLTNGGWAHDALVQVDRCGVITALVTGVGDTSVPRIARSDDDLLDAWIFMGGTACVRHAFVGGRQVVNDRCHVNETSIVNRYRDAAERLLR